MTEFLCGIDQYLRYEDVSTLLVAFKNVKQLLYCNPVDIDYIAVEIG